MNEKEHPRGLSPQQRKEWHKKCKRLLELYASMPQGDTSKKCIAGGDTKGNCMFFFQGGLEEAEIVRKFIYSMETHEQKAR
jgi:hypothetical protein